jgi:flagellin-like protein
MIMKTRTHRRKGISELMGAVLMIAITLVAGVAAFGWVMSQTSISENAYGSHAAANINYLNERETIPFVYFASPTSMVVYIDNTGSETMAAYKVTITGPTGFTTLTCLQGASCTGWNSTNSLSQIPQGDLTTFTLTVSPAFLSGSYVITLLGQFGTTAQSVISR